jgi:hypothetical protein
LKAVVHDCKVIGSTTEDEKWTKHAGGAWHKSLRQLVIMEQADKINEGEEDRPATKTFRDSWADPTWEDFDLYSDSTHYTV